MTTTMPPKPQLKKPASSAAQPHPPSSTNAPADYRKQRRNRLAVSCVNCHQSKRMCDRKRPCSRCVQLGLTGLCVYEVDGKASEGDSSRDESAHLRKRIAELERVVRELKKKPHPRWAASGLPSQDLYGMYRKRVNPDHDECPLSSCEEESQIRVPSATLSRDTPLAAAASASLTSDLKRNPNRLNTNAASSLDSSLSPQRPPQFPEYLALPSSSAGPDGFTPDEELILNMLIAESGTWCSSPLDYLPPSGFHGTNYSYPPGLQYHGLAQTNGVLPLNQALAVDTLGQGSQLSDFSIPDNYMTSPYSEPPQTLRMNDPNGRPRLSMGPTFSDSNCQVPNMNWMAGDLTRDLFMSSADNTVPW